MYDIKPRIDIYMSEYMAEGKYFVLQYKRPNMPAAIIINTNDKYHIDAIARERGFEPIFFGGKVVDLESED